MTAAATPERLLAVEGLTVAPRRGGTALVDDVSFAVRAGETVGLVGESGSGKSTVCRAVTALLADNLAVRSGRIELHGKDLVPLRRSAVHRLQPRGAAMIFQDPLAALNPVQRIGAQISEAVRARSGQNRQAAARTAIDLLTRMGLERAAERMSSYPHELSGGQRQRVVIAMALACEPALLVADEPTSALDVTTQAQILSLLRELARERGLGILLVSHDYGVVAQICSRVAVMYRGQVVEEGLTDEVLSTPRHPYTRALIASLPSVGSRSARLPADTAARRAPVPGGCPYLHRCPEALGEPCGAGYVHELVQVGPAQASACVRAHAASRAAGAEVV